MDEERFSVCRVFDDGTCEYVQRDVTVAVAVEAFASSTTGIGPWLGTVQQVVVMDLDNVVSLEWNFGKGITRKPVIAVKVDVSVPASEHV